MRRNFFMETRECNCGHCHVEQETVSKEANQYNNSVSKSDAKIEENLLNHTFLVSGMDCGHCAAKLEKAIGKLAGVKVAEVNFATGKLNLSYDGNLLAEKDILDVIKNSGYKGELFTLNKKAVTIYKKWYQQSKTLATILAAVLWIFAMGASFIGEENIANLLFALTMISGGFYVAKSGIYALKRFDFDTNLLMVIAAIGAVAIGQWSEGATVVFLFSVGNALQAYTIDKTRQSIQRLMELAPAQALIKKGENEVLLAVEEVVIGDKMIVKPGTRIAMDGVVIGGLSSVNQASITGESMPIEKAMGDKVYAGTVNGTGALEIEVTKLASDSTLSKIMQLVEEAQAEKAPMEQQVDEFAKYYTPTVLVGAILIAFVPTLILGEPLSEWVYKALVLLVISCPCALVISTPVSIVSAIGRASRMGVLIKGGVYLEQLGTMNAIGFDKTGTLTEGKATVTDVIAFHDKTESEVLLLAASVEKWSEHPLAQAILQKVDKEKIINSREFQAMIGKGAVAKVANELIYVGNVRLFNEIGNDMKPYLVQIEEMESYGKTVIIVGTSAILLGIIGISDTIRSNATSALQSLKQAGVEKLVMLSGDNERVAAVVAKKLGIDEYYSGLLPENKVEIVRKLSGNYGKVAMIGDGVNDAPALATADIGIAMGSIGSDAALETADIALMSDDLSKLSTAIELSRKTVAIIRQNITFSILIKAVFIIGTFVGFTNLWLAVLADSGAAVLVTLNGMRLARS